MEVEHRIIVALLHHLNISEDVVEKKNVVPPVGFAALNVLCLRVVVRTNHKVGRNSNVKHEEDHIQWDQPGKKGTERKTTIYRSGCAMLSTQPPLTQKYKNLYC